MTKYCNCSIIYVIIYKCHFCAKVWWDFVALNGGKMKKFIVYLLVIILTVSLGFAIFYLVRDNEVISISSASIYKDAGDSFTLDINHTNKTWTQRKHIQNCKGKATSNISNIQGNPHNIESKSFRRNSAGQKGVTGYI